MWVNQILQKWIWFESCWLHCFVRYKRVNFHNVWFRVLYKWLETIIHLFLFSIIFLVSQILINISLCGFKWWWWRSALPLSVSVFLSVVLSWPQFSFFFVSSAPMMKERPSSAIYPSDSLRQSLLGSRRVRSGLSLAKSVSTNNIAGWEWEPTWLVIECKAVQLEALIVTWSSLVSRAVYRLWWRSVQQHNMAGRPTDTHTLTWHTTSVQLQLVHWPQNIDFCTAATVFLSFLHIYLCCQSSLWMLLSKVMRFGRLVEGHAKRPWHKFDIDWPKGGRYSE